MKNSRIKEPKKTQEPKPIKNFFGNVETPKKAWKKSKKKFQKEKRKQKNFSSVIFTIKGYTTSNNIRLKGLNKIFSEIIYYNYNKKSHYTQICLETKKTNTHKN